MQLSVEDVDQFFRLHRSLMCFVHQRLQVTPEKVATPEAYARLDPESRMKVHEALPAQLDLIDAFTDENPHHLDAADLEIVRSWKHLVTGRFYALRQLKQSMVFLTATDPAIAYGVLALHDPFEALIGHSLPRMLKTTLLPFKGRIVYDGMMSAYNISFGPGIRRRLNETYKEAKERRGIVTSLPPPAERPQRSAPTKTHRKGSSGTSGRAPRGGPATPAEGRSAHGQIVALIDHFCRDHLDEEYADLCRKLAGVLARKRPSPLVRGKPESWASGIIRVIGWANFLGDPSQPHHMRMSDIDHHLGVSEATGAAKSMAIRKLLRIHAFEAEWTLPSRMDDNLMIWMLEVNGLLTDIRTCPREAQEIAYQKGLIPYIPADRPRKSAEK